MRFARSTAAILMLASLALESDARAIRSPLGRATLSRAPSGTGLPEGGGGGPVTCGEDPDPYPLYTSWDRNCAPWHSAAGNWGAQVTLEAPTAPTITSSANASTAAELTSACAVNGRRVTITGSWTGDASCTGSDVEIILGPTRSIGGIQFGAWPYTTPIARVRIRGSTDGATHGGVMGQVRSFALGPAFVDTAPQTTDVILDGIDLNGSSSFGGGETNQSFRLNANRVAILHVRAIAAGYIWEGSNTHVFVGDSNFYSGAASRTDTGYPEGWNTRNKYGPLTIVDSHLETTRYVTIRAQSKDGAGELLYICTSTIANRSERMVLWPWDGVEECPTCTGDGVVVENSFLYGYAATGCAFQGLGPMTCSHVAYSRIRNNVFYSGGPSQWSQATLDSTQAGCYAGGDHDFSEGNTFAEWTSGPAWGGPGSPLLVDLVDFGTPIVGDGTYSCTGLAP